MGCIGDSGIDSDNDKVTDLEENNGWVISVYSINGTMEKRKVNSNPNKADTDNDGLNDFEEMVLLSDPSNKDTDYDGLNDKDEIESNSSIIHFDSWVINVKGITRRVIADYPKQVNSAVQYDSDYDGLSDSEEYFKGSDPLVKDTDSDGDGDFIDPDPCWDLGVELTLESFNLKKNMDYNDGANLYFQLFIGDETMTTEVWDISKGEETLDKAYSIDFPDRNAYLNNKLKIQIIAFDKDTNVIFGDTPIEINGSNEFYIIKYDIEKTGVQEFQTNGDEGELQLKIEILRT